MIEGEIVDLGDVGVVTPQGVAIEMTEEAVSGKKVEEREKSEVKVEKLTAEELYKGNNTVCCGGWCVMGPNKGYFGFALFLLFIPMVLYTIFISSELPLPIAIGGWVAGGLPIILLVKTATTDPGILRRYESPPVEFPPSNLAVEYSDAVKRLWFCHKCNCYRSPRAKHCYLCNNCVEIFDHHCPWTGTCVGQGNYRYFVWFLTSMLVAGTYVSFVVCYYLIEESRKRGKTVWETVNSSDEIPVIILLGYIFLTCFFIAGLALYHYYLICTGQTTREHLKDLFESDRPFSSGFLSNCVRTFCTSDTRLKRVVEAEQVALTEKYRGNVKHNRK